jgi:AcrR family transcriptional regulator
MYDQRMPNATRRSARSRQAILTAALDLVEEVGFSRTSVEGIAARAGVGKQTIYRWWPSKGAVLLDALLALSEGEEGVEPLPDTGDLAGDLKLVLRATVDELSNPRYDAPMRALATEGLHDPALHAQWSERIDEPLTRIREERLRSAQQAGELPEALDLTLAIDLIWGPLFHRWLQSRGPLTPDYADALVDAALSGLRSEP